MTTSSRDDVSDSRSYSHDDDDYDDDDERNEEKKTNKKKGYSLNDEFSDDDGKGTKNNNKNSSSSPLSKKKKKTSFKETVCVFVSYLFIFRACSLFYFFFYLCVFSSALRVSERHATATRARLNFHPPKTGRTNKQTNKTNFLKTIPPKNGDACLVFAFYVYVAPLTFQPLLSLTTTAVRTNSTLTDRSDSYKHQIRFGKCAVKSRTRSTFLAWFYSS